MALRQMRLADDSVNLAFELILEALATGFGLPLGLEGRENAAIEFCTLVESMKAIKTLVMGVSLRNKKHFHGNAHEIDCLKCLGYWSPGTEPSPVTSTISSDNCEISQHISPKEASTYWRRQQHGQPGFIKSAIGTEILLPQPDNKQGYAWTL